jgi:pimeloyl-ACP methyl ester carboxylesterase
MSVPPSASFRPPSGGVPDAGRLAATLPAQLLRSWYILYFQLPWLPERSIEWIVPRLWRKWSPGYRADEDLRHVEAAIVDRAGHFLQLEQPDVVGRHGAEFVGQAG